MDAIRSFDFSMLLWLNRFAQGNDAIDTFIFLLSKAPLAKIGPYGAFLWWLWFLARDRPANRLRVVQSVIAALLATLLSRLIQIGMPHRPRPLHNPDLAFVVPDGVNPGTLYEWSSFPSDHAALVFALATAVWTVSRRLGGLAYLWAAIVVCLPRLYLGYHYPSDIIGGALLGIVCCALTLRMPFWPALSRGILNVEAKHAALFYAAAFLLVYQLVTLFDDMRQLGRGVANLIKAFARTV